MQEARMTSSLLRNQTRPEGRGRSNLIRVALVSEVRLYRDGLAQMIGADERFEVALKLDTCSFANVTVIEAAPDVVLVDLSAAGSRVLIGGLVARAPEIKV